MTTKTAYTHEPLQQPDSIRLLRLFSGPRDVELFGQLFQVRQSENPTYEAVSYVWGERDSTKELLLRPKPRGADAEMASTFQISQNLFDVLQSLRLGHEDRLLWIDAICIDQANSTEKGHQVACMDRVFSKASCVLVWLGRSQMGDQFHELRELVDLREFGRWSETPIQLTRGRPDPKLLDLLHGNDHWRTNVKYDQRGFHDSLQIFRRLWWRRLWIVQEFLLARRCELRVGNVTVDLMALQKAVLLAKRLEEVVDEHLMNFYDRDVIDNFLRTIEPARYLLGSKYGSPNHAGIHNLDKTYDISDVVFGFSRSRFCTDERDRIYALLGIGSVLSKTRLPILPDYNRSPEEIFHDFATILLERGSLAVLDECSMDVPKRYNTLSFVPEPTHTPQRAAHIRRGRGSGTRFFRSSASNRFKAGCAFSANVSAPGNASIQARGVAIDKVTDSGSMSHFTGGGVWDDSARWNGWKQTLEGCVYWLRHSCQISRPSDPLIRRWNSHSLSSHSLWGLNPYPNQPFVHVFLRTISADAEGYKLDSTRWPGFTDSSLPDDIHGILSASTYYLHNRVLFMTSQGYLVFGPQSLEADDEVVIFDGAATPFVLRQHEDEWKIVGPCYLHGWMYGDYFRHAVIDPFTNDSQERGDISAAQNRDRYEGTLWYHKCRPPGHGDFKTLTKRHFVIC